MTFIIVGLIACESRTDIPVIEPVVALQPSRVVAVGPAIAQVVHELSPTSLVAVDTAGKELPGLTELPTVGFSRQVSAEGVLSANPDLVLMSERAGPPAAIEQIEAAGIKVVRLPHERSVEGIEKLTAGVGAALHADPGPMLQTFRDKCDALKKPEQTVRALFVYARGGGVMNVSGTGTAADAMLGIAGLSNAVDAYEGYKPLTPEAAVKADPDVVVFTTKGLEAAGGVAGVKKIAGLSLVPAVQEGRVHAIDDLQLLSLGIDICDAAAALNEAIRR